MNKQCTSCQESKSLELFPVRSDNGNRRNICSDCYRKKYSKRDGVYTGSAEYQKKLREENAERYRNYQRNRYSPNNIKVGARSIVAIAIRVGILNKPYICPQCKKSGNIEAHHEDYKKPLEITWLCKECHEQHHSLLFHNKNLSDGTFKR